MSISRKPLVIKLDQEQKNLCMILLLFAFFLCAYGVKIVCHYERRLKEQTDIIQAHNEVDAWLKAWMMFPEYKELSVTQKE